MQLCSNIKIACYNSIFNYPFLTTLNFHFLLTTAKSDIDNIPIAERVTTGLLLHDLGLLAIGIAYNVKLSTLLGLK